MVSDTSLTNIYVVNGVAQIRYRAYTSPLHRSSLLASLKRSAAHTDPLIQAYNDLCDLHIPCTWRVSTAASRLPSAAEVPLELWVFWFEDRHTGLIDGNPSLSQLEEFKMGSFTWDTIAASTSTSNATTTTTTASSSNGRTSTGVASSSSATNSSHSGKPALRARTLLSVSEEYKLFIKSIRNLITRAMLLSGSIPLGDFFITPLSDEDHLFLFSGSNRRGTATESPMTVVGCAYSTYITGTDLVFRPYTRRLRLRPLTAKDADHDGLKIITSPSGENASIVSCISEISEQAQEEILREWSSLYNIPIQYLHRHHYHHPPLVSIRTKTNATVLYPSALVFVPTSIRSSSTRTAGMDGVLGCNRGLTSDIGNHWSRWAWIEQLKSSGQQIENGCRVDYWGLGDITSRVLEALDTANVTQEQMALKKMYEQQTSTAVAHPSPGTRQENIRQIPSSSSIATAPHDEGLITTVGGAKPGTDSLVDFIMRTFSNVDSSSIEEGPVEDMMDVTAASSAIDTLKQTPLENGGNNGQAALVANRDPSDPLNTDDFGLSYDAMFQTSNQQRWENDLMDDNYDNFNFDVTEADFDFFESSRDDGNKKSPAMDLDAPPSTVATTVDLLSVDTFETQPPTDTPMIEAPPPSIKEEQQHNNSNHPMTLVSPIESDITAVASSSDAGASTTVPGTVDMATPVDTRFPHILLEKSSAYASDSPHRVIPRGFSPVVFVDGVDNTKYMSGGKFMYKPTSGSLGADDEDEDGTTTMGSNVYRPDYIPKHLLSKKDKQDKTESTPMRMSSDHDDHDDSSTDGVDDDESDSDSDSDTCTSSSSSSSSNEGSHRGHVDPFERIKCAQMTHVRRLLGDIRNKPKRRRVINLATDYDSPFSSGVMDTISPEKMTPEDIVSLEFLCRQTVWGGYPFAGELPECMPKCADGIFPKEDAESIIARQTTLIQSIRGDITHVPCLPSTTGHVLHEFKVLLQHIFGQPVAEDSTDTAVMEGMSPSGSQSLMPSIGVKGPLRVQEYYQLLETAQTHSRYYGKYQVKKKRPTEPDLVTLSPPDIVVGRNDDWIEGSASLVHVWEKMKLEPYSYRNNVIYFVVYPESFEFGKSVATFINGLSTAYEVCNLGTHRPGRISHYPQGVVPVPLFMGSWKEGYRTACESLGTALGQSNLLDQEQNTTNIVIYLINPSIQLSSNLELSRCFRRVVSAYTAATGNSGNPKTIHPHELTMQIIPAEHVMRLDKTNGLHVYKDIAFSVYSQCHTMLERQKKVDNTRSISSLYTPAWVIAQRVPKTIRFSMKQPLITYPNVVIDPDAMLHMAYSFSLDRRWMVIAWTDHRGELIEFAVLEIPTASSKSSSGSPLVKVFTEAWKRTKKISSRTGFSWQYALAKVGLIFDSELQVWEDVFSSAGDLEEKIAIVCIDLDSSLYVNTLLSGSSPSATLSAEEQAAQAMSQIPESYTYASSQSTTASSSTTPKHKPAASSSSSPDGTCMMILNHRVAYSRQRVNIYQGDLSMDSMNELDKWVLALSTGYLIKQSTNQEAVDDHPLVIEIHLVYNKYARAARSVLREILKQYDALSYVNHPPSSVSTNGMLLPTHLVVVERLSRILLAVGS